MISIGDNHRIAASVSFQAKRIVIGKNCVIHDRVTFLGESVEIGDDVWIGQDAVLDGTGGLKIGNHVTISIGDQLFSHTGTKGVMLKKEPIVVKDYAWLMSRVSVNPGVTIGKDSRIANGSIVTHDVPDNAVALGSPAKVVGTVAPKERLSYVLKHKS